jgi:hypothetical protein
VRELTPAERHAETYDWAGLLVREYVTMRYPPSTTVLDVGAGRGKYRDLLGEYDKVDAVEVFEPVIESEHLADRYRRVFHANVTQFAPDPNRPKYDVVIMGDVLEHIEVNDARRVLDLFLADDSDVIVVVPYLFPQGEEDGNVHQCHVQDDLTVHVMHDRFPTLRLAALETHDWRPFKGLYLRSDS